MPKRRAPPTVTAPSLTHKRQIEKLKKQAAREKALRETLITYIQRGARELAVYEKKAAVALEHDLQKLLEAFKAGEPV